MKKKPLSHYLDLMKSAQDRQGWIKEKKYGEIALKKLSIFSYSPLEEFLLYCRLDYAYDQLSEYSHSFDVLYKANLVATKHQLGEANIAFVSLMLGRSFLRIKSVSQAIVQFKKVEQYYQRYGYDSDLMDKENYFNNIISLGYCYLYNNNLEQVWEIIEKRLSYQLPALTKLALCNYYHLRGEYLIAMKDFSNARQSLTEFLNLGIESNLYQPILEAKLHFVTIDLLEGKLEFAIETLISLLKEAGQAKANEYICGIGLLLSKCYMLKNMPAKSTAIEKRIRPILSKLDIVWLYEQNKEFEQIYQQFGSVYNTRAGIPVILTQTLSHYYKILDSEYPIIGKSYPMQEIHKLVEKIASTNLPVLIHGETGTGKELVARAIHNNSPRSGKSWLALNCGAIPETLLENELFGHAKGAFTDAREDKKGYIELTSEGTLFLDEISEMSPVMQQKLLRVLEEKQVWSLGSEKPIPINTRFVFASNQNIEELVKSKKFRADLYYRINTIVITLPPLRDRRDDIPLLINHFLNKYSPNQTQDAGRLTPDALALFMNYSWPGNIRELENEIERICALYPRLNDSPPGCRAGVGQADIKPITKGMLSEMVRNNNSSAGLLLHKDAISFKEARKISEMNLIISTLKKSNGNIAQSARLLGCTRRYLHRKIKQLKIDTKSIFVTKS